MKDIFVSNKKYRSLQNEAAQAANKSFEAKDFVPSGLMSVGEEAMVLKGSFLIILTCALGLTAYLVDQQVPDKMFAWLQTFISSKITFLLILNLFLILVGMVMDIFSAVIVVAPLITPMAVKFGVDPVHLGIMFLCNIEIGYNFPPFGMNLIIASQRFNKSILEVSKATIPFTLLLIAGLLLLTYVPEISLFLLPAK